MNKSRRWGIELLEGSASRTGYEGCVVIDTARTESAINTGAESGFFPLVKEVVRNTDIRLMIGVDQDQLTGRVRLVSDVREMGGNIVVSIFNHYPYHFPNPFAAYLVPPDLVPGERVWIDDLIEDIVAIWGNQGYQPRLACAPAIWDGKEFVIQFDSKIDAEIWMG